MHYSLRFWIRELHQESSVFHGDVGYEREYSYCRTPALLAQIANMSECLHHDSNLAISKDQLLLYYRLLFSKYSIILGFWWWRDAPK